MITIKMHPDSITSNYEISLSGYIYDAYRNLSKEELSRIRVVSKLLSGYTTVERLFNCAGVIMDEELMAYAGNCYYMTILPCSPKGSL